MPGHRARCSSHLGRAAASLAALTLWAAGCSDAPAALPPDSSTSPTDAGPGGDGGAPVFPVDPVVAPALPTLTPCPPGFTERALGHGMTACEPLGSDDGSACPSGEARFAGEDGCQSIGRACPAAAFPDDAPSGSFYVDPTAAAGGDGSRARPFRTAVEAYPVATPGDTIVLSRGVHAPLGLLPSGLSVRGTCVAETRVVCGGPTSGVDIDGEVSIEEVTFDDCAYGVYVRPDSPADYQLTNIAFTRVRHSAIYAFSGRGAGESLAFVSQSTELLSDALQCMFGVNFGARLDAVRVSANSPCGALVSGEGTEVTLEGVLVRDPRPASDSTAGGCLTVGSGGSLTVRRALLDRCRDTGANGYDGAALVLEDAVVRGVLRRESASWGAGVLGTTGANITLRRVLVEDVSRGGVWVYDPLTVATVEDLVVTHSGYGSAEFSIGGVEVSSGAAMTATRVAIDDVMHMGLSAHEVGTTVNLADWAISGVHPDASSNFGYGALLGSPDSRVARLRIRDVTTAGLSLTDASRTTVADVSVADVHRAAAGDAAGFTVGIVINRGQDVGLERAEVADVEGSGIVMSFEGGTDLSLSHAYVHDLVDVDQYSVSGVSLASGTARVSDVLVERVYRVAIILHDVDAIAERVTARNVVEHASLAHARALSVQDGARVMLTDAVLAEAGATGALVLGGGTVLTAERLSIFDVGVPPCLTCLTPGVGLGAGEGGRASISDFVITRSALAGILLTDGEIDLSVGEVSSSPIGVNVSRPEFDIARLQDRVIYKDNGINLDSQLLRLPSSTPGSLMDAAGG